MWRDAMAFAELERLETAFERQSMFLFQMYVTRCGQWVSTSVIDLLLLSSACVQLRL
eukprot:m.1141906 g.1141906  ORF g.1141906 m.1141906 type:complete len:57 (+) comp24452_c0_seq6:156-326(+)